MLLPRFLCSSTTPPSLMMLNLKTDSPERWLEQVDNHLEEILIDHAHCENKAARAALNLLMSYVENEKLTIKMTEIVNEELEHFHQVLGMLKKRGIKFRRLSQSNYGSQMKQLIRPQEPQRAVDRLLVAALIEARSCERFDLLRHHIDDVELSDFYDALFVSEARHYSVYVQLAADFAPRREVELRLQDLARAEAEIINKGDTLPRMHS